LFSRFLDQQSDPQFHFRIIGRSRLAERFRLGVKKTWLYLTAGLMWAGVGVYLSILACGWFSVVVLGRAIRLAGVGILLAIAIWKFGFSVLAKKNICRIKTIQRDKPSIFAFQKWTNYPLVVVMIALGVVLRHSPIPKPYLAVLYLGIGGGLFLSSLSYYPRVFFARS
jgi:hypothetical protein